jgi:hypothetical protein
MDIAEWSIMRIISARSAAASLLSAGMFLGAATASAQEPPPPLPPPTAPAASPPPVVAPVAAPVAPQQPAQPAYVIPEGCVEGKDAAGSPLIYCPRPADAPVVQPATKREWYGWQVLLVDAGSILVMIGGAAAQSGAVAGTGGLIYLGGPAVVHFAHGNVAKGFGSMGLRLGAPFAGALLGFGVGAASCSSDRTSCAAVGAGLGFLTGYLAGISIDAGLLAYEDVKAETSAPAQSGARAPAPRVAKAPKASSSLTVIPSAAVTPQGGSVGLVGTF